MHGKTLFKKISIFIFCITLFMSLAMVYLFASHSMSFDNTLSGNSVIGKTDSKYISNSINYTNKNVAYADEGKFIKIENDGVYFNVDQNLLPSNSIKFEIPKNFYILYNGTMPNGDYEVSYMGITGWISKDAITSVPETSITVENPYFIYNDTVQGKKNPLKVNKDISLRTLPSYDTGSNTGNLLTSGTAIEFLGMCTKDASSYNNTNYWYCVKAGDTIGYIHSSNTNAENFNTSSDIARIYNETDSTPTNGDGTYTPTGTEPENNLVRILLIIGITVPAIIIVILLFKPSKNKNNDSYTWDRNIYDSNGKDKDDDYDPRL